MAFPCHEGLFSELETIDDLAVLLGVFPLQVVQEPAPFGNQLQKAAARMVIAEMGLEVIAQIVDALGQKGYLDLTGSRVLVARAVLADYRGFYLFGQGHATEGIPLLRFYLLCTGVYYTSEAGFCKAGLCGFFSMRFAVRTSELICFFKAFLPEKRRILRMNFLKKISISLP